MSLSPRVLTALIAIPLVILVVYFGGPLFLAVALLLALLSMRELEIACRRAGLPLEPLVAYPALLLIMFSAPRTGTDQYAPAALVLMLLAWAALRYKSAVRPTLLSVALTLLAICYIGLFAYLPLVRGIKENGFSLMWLTLLAVWGGDTAAYYAGRAFGRRKLTPLSPGKTVEGAITGFVATVIICLLVAWRAHLAARHGIALGILIGITAPLGDLAESFWKRELQVKDLGRILPGHGGVLDRCDSLLFAAAVVYAYSMRFI